MSKKYQSLFILLASMAICLSSCNGDKQSHEIANIKLTGSVVTASDDYIIGYNGHLFNDSLIEMSRIGDNLCNVSIFMADSLLQADGFGRRGAGPNELLDGYLGKSPSGDYVIIDSPSGINSKIYSVPADNLHNHSEWQHINVDTLSIMTSAFVVLDDSCLLMSSAPYGSEKSIFTIINYRTGACYPTDFWPEDGYSGPAYPKLYIYTANAKLQASGDGRFVYSPLYGDYAFIFSLEGKHVNVLYTLANNPIEYTVQDALNPKINHKPYLSEMSSNGKHIYRFHYNKKDDGTLSESILDTRGGNDVDVYDWDGNLVKQYTLDRLGHLIMVNGADTDLYLLATNPESGANEWVRYEIE